MPKVGPENYQTQTQKYSKLGKGSEMEGEEAKRRKTVTLLAYFLEPVGAMVTRRVQGPWTALEYPPKFKESVRVRCCVVLRHVASSRVVLCKCCVSVVLCFVVLWFGGEFGCCFCNVRVLRL